MATRCYIGIKIARNKFQSIYCHNDGHPTSVGKRLKEHYSDRIKAESLIALGDMRGLKKTVEESYFYGRDGGQTEYINPESRNMKEMLDGSYAYVFDGENWLCASKGFKKLVSIDDAIAQQLTEE